MPDTSRRGAVDGAGSAALATRGMPIQQNSDLSAILIDLFKRCTYDAI
jgi:hypothetical protein